MHGTLLVRCSPKRENEELVISLIPTLIECSEFGLRERDHFLPREYRIRTVPYGTELYGSKQLSKLRFTAFYPFKKRFTFLAPRERKNATARTRYGLVRGRH